MSNSRSPLLALLLTSVFLLTACARITPPSPSSTAPRAKPAKSEPTREPAAPPVPEEPPVEQPPPIEQPAPAVERPSESAVISPPPVLALLEEAEASRNSGELDGAAAVLERGIRIQPNNPVLWQRLAQVRLQQGQPQLAEELAKKSNVFAAGNASLLRENWALIAEARRRKGDVEGARDAEAKVNQTR